MTTKKKAQGGAQGKRHDGTAQAAEALSALYNAGAFDFINNMLGRTVGEVSARLGIERPAKFGAPRESPTVEDFAEWLAKIPPTFDPDDLTGRRPREIYDEKGVQRNPLSGAELASLAQEVGAHLFGKEEAVSLYLLLLYSLANEHDEADRSAAYFEACESLSLSVDGVQEAFEADHVRRLAALRARGGGGDEK